MNPIGAFVLFWRINPVLHLVVFCLLVVSSMGPWFEPPQSSPLLIAVIVAIVIGLAAHIIMRSRQPILAAYRGARLAAKVTDIKLFSRGEQGRPTLFCLTWREPDGTTGQSVPRRIGAFDGVSVGDTIVVHRHGSNPGWWHKDLFGPVFY